MSDLPKYLIGSILGLVLGFVVAKGDPLWISNYEGCFKQYVLQANTGDGIRLAIAYCARRFPDKTRTNALPK